MAITISFSPKQSHSTKAPSLSKALFWSNLCLLGSCELWGRSLCIACYGWEQRIVLWLPISCPTSVPPQASYLSARLLVGCRVKTATWTPLTTSARPPPTWFALCGDWRTRNTSPTPRHASTGNAPPAQTKLSPPKTSWPLCVPATAWVSKRSSPRYSSHSSPFAYFIPVSIAHSLFFIQRVLFYVRRYKGLNNT